MGLAVKNPSANAGNIRWVGSIPGSGRSLGGGNGNLSRILAWKIPWTEKPGRLQSVELERVNHGRVTNCTCVSTHTLTHTHTHTTGLGPWSWKYSISELSNMVAIKNY